MDEMGAHVDAVRILTDAAFVEWGWTVVASHSNENLLYKLRGDPYSEFSIAIMPGKNHIFTVSVPLPRIGVQYYTTIYDFSEACAFLRNHLDYFMKAMLRVDAAR